MRVFADNARARGRHGAAHGCQVGPGDERDHLDLGIGLGRGGQRRQLLQPKRPGEGVVDAVFRHVEIGVGGIAGDAFRRHARAQGVVRFIGAQVGERVPDQRVVRHTHVGAGPGRSGQGAAVHGQAREHAGHFLAGAAGVQARLVPTTGKLRRRPALHGRTDIAHTDGHGFSSALAAACSRVQATALAMPSLRGVCGLYPRTARAMPMFAT